MSIIVHRACHAKINLSLAVGCPIPNDQPGAGLHPICSWMACVQWHDDLSLSKVVCGRTSYDRRWADGSPVSWSEDVDLAVRAHRAMEGLIGRELPVHLTLRKAIPAGGGLGGGSSNAAGVLLGLRELFALPVSDEQLLACARLLGSDVPFFLCAMSEPRPAIVRGLGDAVERLGPMSFEVLLVLPPAGCETKAVYQAFDELGLGASFEEHAQVIESSARAGDHSALSNDLLLAAVHRYPWLGAAKDALELETNATVHLSGSGSTLFVINPALEQHEFERIAPSCRVIRTRTI